MSFNIQVTLTDTKAGVVKTLDGFKHHCTTGTIAWRLFKALKAFCVGFSKAL